MIVRVLISSFALLLLGSASSAHAESATCAPGSGYFECVERLRGMNGQAGTGSLEGTTLKTLNLPEPGPNIEPQPGGPGVFIGGPGVIPLEATPEPVAAPAEVPPPQGAAPQVADPRAGMKQLRCCINGTNECVNTWANVVPNGSGFVVDAPFWNTAALNDLGNGGFSSSSFTPRNIMAAYVVNTNFVLGGDGSVFVSYHNVAGNHDGNCRSY